MTKIGNNFSGIAILQSKTLFRDNFADIEAKEPLLPAIFQLDQPVYFFKI